MNHITYQMSSFSVSVDGVTFTMDTSPVTFTITASSAAANIKQWANRRYNLYGDNWEVCLCDKWHQKLDENSGSLSKLLKDPLFMLILMEANETFC